MCYQSRICPMLVAAVALLLFGVSLGPVNAVPPMIEPNQELIVRHYHENREMIVICTDRQITEWYMIKNNQTILLKNRTSHSNNGTHLFSTLTFDQPQPYKQDEKNPLLNQANAYYYFCVRVEQNGDHMLKTVTADLLSQMHVNQEAARIIVTEGPHIFRVGEAFYVTCYDEQISTNFSYYLPAKCIAIQENRVELITVTKNKQIYKQLEVSNSTLNDTGIYTCPDYKLHYFHFYAHGRPTPRIIDEPTTPTANGEVRLSVLFELLDDPTLYERVRWLTPHSQIIYSNNSDYKRQTWPIDFYRWRAVLSVHHPNSSSEGAYHAQIHRLQATTINVTRHLTGPFATIALNVSGGAIVLRIGQWAHVSCTTTGQPPPSIGWYWTDCPAPIDGDTKRWPDRSQCRLPIDLKVANETTESQSNGILTSRVRWLPTGPGIVACAGGEMRWQEARVYLMDAAMPATMAVARLPQRVTTSAGQRHQFVCLVDRYNHSGRLDWQRNGRYVSNDTTDGTVQIKRYASAYTTMVLLIIDGIRADDVGDYECVFDGDEVVRRIELNDGDLLVRNVGICALAFVLLLSVGLLSYLRGINVGLKRSGIKYFLDGDMDKFDTEQPHSEQAHLLPYECSFEFPLDRLLLSKLQLGVGAFGIVFRAQALGIEPHVAETTVAVKMAKSSDSDEAIRSLIAELKIMAHIGRHEHVLRLLGAVTRAIRKRKLYVITEFCELGNLHDFLKAGRTDYVDQLDEAGDRIVLKGVPSSSTLDTMPLLDNDQRSRTITTTDLLRWSAQAASGMAYLVARGVLHGDLAARNCLLNADRRLKIGDFGLSRALRKNENYHKASDDPLPIKWMAIEAIRDNCFNNATDVWSFGVLLWELFSLAEEPYEGILNGLVLDRLRIGYRMTRPAYATHALHQLMCDCWLEDAGQRPAIAEIERRLGEMYQTLLAAASNGPC